MLYKQISTHEPKYGMITNRLPPLMHCAYQNIYIWDMRVVCHVHPLKIKAKSMFGERRERLIEAQ